MLQRERSSETDYRPGKGTSNAPPAVQHVGGDTTSLAPQGGLMEVCKGPNMGLPDPCPHCGRRTPHTVPPRPSEHLTANLQGSSQSVSSRRSQSRDSLAQSTVDATDNGPAGIPERSNIDGSEIGPPWTELRTNERWGFEQKKDDRASFLGLLLACLTCRCSVLLLGLLDGCATCLHSLCSCCCSCCWWCCAEVRDAPGEEFNCHAPVFQSCCESTECLEFCLDCCLICHQS